MRLPVHLPFFHLDAELTRLSEEHDRAVMDAELEAVRVAGKLCLSVTFPDGMRWVVPLDPEAQDIVDAVNATTH